ncbi:MAG: hypothetical protein D3903_20685 [Candidatus Electrothrix sp. GM3_4]|nr:hypothetical protein [Candidatus Electrothrix sp. GM3_4]
MVTMRSGFKKKGSGLFSCNFLRSSVICQHASNSTNNSRNTPHHIVQRGQLTGSERFREELSRRTGIRFSNRGPGRPKKREK